MMRALFLLYAIWGFNWVVMKTANAYFPPVLFVAFRFLIGAAVMGAFHRRQQVAPGIINFCNAFFFAVGISCLAQQHSVFKKQAQN